jgi:hypothetical protein
MNTIIAWRKIIETLNVAKNDKIIIKGDEKVQKGKKRLTNCYTKLIDHFLSK